MKGSNYEKVFEALWTRVRGLDLAEAAVPLGARDRGGGRVEMTFLEEPLIVSRQGIHDARGGVPREEVRIVLCHYLLRGGRGETFGEWVAYRELKDSAFFMPHFKENVERRISRAFAGRLNELTQSVRRVGGRSHHGGPSADGTWRIQVLPRIPVLLLFRDEDDEFPADARLLFDRSADVWLDAECLAVVGGVVAHRLSAAAGGFDTDGDSVYKSKTATSCP